MSREPVIRYATLEDAPRLLEIYGWYVENTAISFEYTVPTLEEFRGRIERTLRRYPYLVVEEEGRIMGYCHARPFVGRKAYDWSAELTIYLDHGAKKRGYGRLLYEALEKELSRMGILNLYACIGQSCKQSCRCALAGGHARSDSCNEGDLVKDLNVVRLELTLYLIDDLFDLAVKHPVIDYYRHSVYSRRYMLYSYVVIFHYAGQLSDEAFLTGHVAFVYSYYCESLAAGYTGYDLMAALGRPCRYHCAGILRLVCVSDVDRNVRHPCRENSLFMQNAGSHVR